MKKKSRENALLVPIILALGFVPLLVHSYVYNTHYDVFDWFPDNSVWQTDFFLAYKMFALIILGSIMAVILVYSHFHDTKTPLSFEPSFYCLIAYGILVILSTLFSKYTAYAIRGGYEMFEPVWAVIAYLILCYYTYHFVRTEDQIYKILHFAGIGIFIVSLIGVFQFFKLDFFRTDIGKMLMLNPSAWDVKDTLTFTFQPGQVYTTLYNVDFLSFYFGTLIPVAIALCISARTWKMRIIYFIMTLMFAICFLGSTALSGIIAIIAACILGLYILLSRKKKLFAVGIGVGFGIMLVSLLICSNTPLGKSIQTHVWGEGNDYMNSATVSSITTNNEDVTFIVNNEPLKICYFYDDASGYFSVICYDAQDNILPLTITDDGLTFQLQDSRYGECNISEVLIDEYVSMKVNIDNHDWHFTNQLDGTYYYYNSAAKLTKFPDFKYRKILPDLALSGRGEIWNHIIPLLPGKIFLGSGANTFAIAYPNDDYLTAVYSGLENILDVKAHCWYLMQCVETGIIGTLCLLAFLLWYVVRSIKIYRKADLHQPISILGYGLFIGILTYLITAMANDSNVCTAPVFWTIFGLGMVVNRLVNNQAQ